MHHFNSVNIGQDAYQSSLRQPAVWWVMLAGEDDFICTETCYVLHIVSEWVSAPNCSLYSDTVFLCCVCASSTNAKEPFCKWRLTVQHWRSAVVIATLLCLDWYALNRKKNLKLISTPLSITSECLDILYSHFPNFALRQKFSYPLTDDTKYSLEDQFSYSITMVGLAHCGEVLRTVYKLPHRCTYPLVCIWPPQETALHTTGALWFSREKWNKSKSYSNPRNLTVFINHLYFKYAQ